MIDCKCENTQNLAQLLTNLSIYNNYAQFILRIYSTDVLLLMFQSQNKFQNQYRDPSVTLTHTPLQYIFLSQRKEYVTNFCKCFKNQTQTQSITKWTSLKSTDHKKNIAIYVILLNLSDIILLNLLQLNIAEQKEKLPYRLMNKFKMYTLISVILLACSLLFSQIQFIKKIKHLSHSIQHPLSGLHEHTQITSNKRLLRQLQNGQQNIDSPPGPPPPPPPNNTNGNDTNSSSQNSTNMNNQTNYNSTQEKKTFMGGSQKSLITIFSIVITFFFVLVFAIIGCIVRRIYRIQVMRIGQVGNENEQTETQALTIGRRFQLIMPAISCSKFHQHVGQSWQKQCVICLEQYFVYTESEQLKAISTNNSLSTSTNSSTRNIYSLQNNLNKNRHTKWKRQKNSKNTCSTTSGSTKLIIRQQIQPSTQRYPQYKIDTQIQEGSFQASNMKDSTSVELLQSDTKRAFNNNGCEIGNDSIILDKKQNQSVNIDNSSVHQNEETKHPNTSITAKKGIQVKDSEVKLTHCGHLIHAQCIDHWLQRDYKCPLCRQSFTYRNIKEWENKLGVKLMRKKGQKETSMNMNKSEKSNTNIQINNNTGQQSRENNNNITTDKVNKSQIYPFNGQQIARNKGNRRKYSMGEVETNCKIKQYVDKNQAELSQQERNIIDLYSKIMDYHRAHLNNTNVPNNNNNTGEIKDGNVNPGQVETHHERRRQIIVEELDQIQDEGRTRQNSVGLTNNARTQLISNIRSLIGQNTR